MQKVKDFYQIGEVAKDSEFSIHTIRYYEKLGLLHKPKRTNGGFRMYSTETVERLRFIKKSQELGFTLSEIRNIMRQSDKGLTNCCNYTGNLLRNKLKELEGRVGELNKMKQGLKDLLKCWIPIEEAKKKRFAVCPQIETVRTRKRGVMKNGKKKS